MLSYLLATIQNSARTQQSASPVAHAADHDQFSRPPSSSSSEPPAFSLQILIANPRLECELSSNDSSQLQISNRERMAASRFTRSFRPPRFRLSQTTCNSSRRSVFLIVTPRLEFPATATKQNSNAISNRYKTPFFAPLSRSSPITRRTSCPCPEKAQGRRRVTVAPTSRKAIMSRNQFTQIPRSKPLMRKVTNADANQS
jgi:hypothetical protein